MKSDHYFKKYINFIENMKDRKIPENAQTELHHIYPKSLYPWLENDKNNLIELTLREHYISHVLLAKSYGGKMWFALNMMNRIIPQEKKSSYLYKLYRKKIIDEFSNINKGRKHTQAAKNKMSKERKGKVIVRNKTTKAIFRTTVENLCTDDNLEFYRTGFKHSKDTIEKMKLHNGIKNKSPYFNENDEIRYFSKTDEIPHGYKSRYPDSVIQKMSASHENASFYYNEITKKTIRSKENPGNGFERKRVKTGNFHGWDKLNKKERMFNLKEKKYELLDKNEIKSYHVFLSGIKYDKITIYNFKDIYFVSRTDFLNYEFEDGLKLKYLLNGDNLLVNNPKEVLNTHIRKNTPQKIAHFRLKYKDKKCGDLGIKIFTLENFEFEEGMKFFMKG